VPISELVFGALTHCRHFGRIAVACQILGRDFNRWWPYGRRWFFRVRFFPGAAMTLGDDCNICDGLKHIIGLSREAALQSLAEPALEP
jgi:hypothetical protein